MENVYVYVYLDPRKPGIFKSTLATFLFEPIYVGMGKGDRFKSHLSEAKKSSANVLKLNKIRKILEEYGDPFILVFDVDTRERAIELEISLISQLGRIDINSGPLVNMTSGGEGTCSLSRESLVKRGKSISKGLTGVSKGRTHTESWKTKQSEGIRRSFKEYQNKFDLEPSDIKVHITDIDLKSTDSNFFGSSNRRATYYYILITPSNEFIFVNKGCVNNKCKELGLPEWSILNCANVFESSGKLFRVRKSTARGWSAIKFKSLSDNPFVCYNGQSASKPDENQEGSTTIESVTIISEEASRVGDKLMISEAVS